MEMKYLDSFKFTFARSLVVKKSAYDNLSSLGVLINYLQWIAKLLTNQLLFLNYSKDKKITNVLTLVSKTLGIELKYLDSHSVE